MANIIFKNQDDVRAVANTGTFVDIPIKPSNYDYVTWADKIDWGQFTITVGNKSASVNHTYDSLINALISVMGGESTPTPTQTYTVTFSGNGGTVSGSTTRSINAGSAVGALPSATRSGYNLVGWNTSSTATTSNVTASTVPTGNVTYYAIWSPIPVTTYTVTFNGNGGTVSGSTTRSINAGSSIGSFPTVTRSGYNLIGWNTSSTATTSNVTTSTVPTGNVTYYAIWSPVPVTTYTVTFSGNGGTVSGSTTRSINAGSVVGELPSATRNGYNLVGWNTSSTATTSNVTASTVPSGNVTYYAIWSPESSGNYWFSIGTTEVTSSNYQTANGATQVSSYPSSTSYTVPSGRAYIYVLIKSDKNVQIIEPYFNVAIDTIDTGVNISGYKVIRSATKCAGTLPVNIS